MIYFCHRTIATAETWYFIKLRKGCPGIIVLVLTLHFSKYGNIKRKIYVNNQIAKHLWWNKTFCLKIRWKFGFEMAIWKVSRVLKHPVEHDIFQAWLLKREAFTWHCASPSSVMWLFVFRWKLAPCAPLGGRGTTSCASECSPSSTTFRGFGRSPGRPSTIPSWAQSKKTRCHCNLGSHCTCS